MAATSYEPLGVGYTTVRRFHTSRAVLIQQGERHIDLTPAELLDLLRYTIREGLVSAGDAQVVLNTAGSPAAEVMERLRGVSCRT